MLAEARTRIVRHTPAEAAAADEILLVDPRSADERARTGAIPVLVGGFEAWQEAGLPVE